MRFNPDTGVYRDCRWCDGKGCLQCKREADADYKRAFPNGPVPLAAFKLDDEQDMAAARMSIGIEAIEKAFGPGGGGVAEIVANIARESK